MPCRIQDLLLEVALACGADRARTDDLFVANEALSQAELQPRVHCNREKDKLSPAFGGILKVAATHYVRGQLWDYSPETMADCQRSMDNGQ